MSLDVVRVPVPAVLVIGDKDLGLVEPYQRRYAVGDLGQRDVAERARVAVGLPARHTGVLVAEELEAAHAQ